MSDVRAPSPRPGRSAFSSCGQPERTADDLYRLVLPDEWTFKDLAPWRTQGLAVRQLVELGVRIEKTCLACQSRQDEGPV